jgi:hypothetical protein
LPFAVGAVAADVAQHVLDRRVLARVFFFVPVRTVEDGRGDEGRRPRVGAGLALGATDRLLADLGALGPVSEGLFVWVAGLGVIIAFTIWLTSRTS